MTDIRDEMLKFMTEANPKIEKLLEEVKEYFFPATATAYYININCMMVFDGSLSAETLNHQILSKAPSRQGLRNGGQ